MLPALGLFATSALVQPISAAQPSSAGIPKIISDQQTRESVYLPDFSYAGYGFGIDPIPGVRGKIIDVTSHGAVPDDKNDDSKAILEALEEAHSVEGPVTVRFAPGRFIITEILNINRSDIVLQGAGRGEGGTTLNFPRPLRMVGDNGKLDELREYLIKGKKRQREKNRNLDVLFSEFSWSGGFIWVGKKNSRPAPYLEEKDPPFTSVLTVSEGSRGRRVVSVLNPGAVSVGDWIDMGWFNRQGEQGALIDSIYGDTNLKIGSHHWTFQKRPLVRQRTQVSAIDGNKITLGDPLLHDINAQLPVSVEVWEPLTNVGIEDFRIEFPNAANFGHHTEEGYNGVYLTGAANSWIRNIVFHNPDAGILTYDSANVTIRDIRVQGERSNHYGVHMGNVHNVLADRIQIFSPVIHSLTFNTQSTKCVYTNSEVFSSPTLDQHAGANHQNLFDNVTVHIAAKRKDDKPVYPIYDGSGAGYWQPGHGSFSTTWNMKVIVEAGAFSDETVLLEGLAEGPDARVIGISGNRNFELDYRPKPYIEHMNSPIDTVPSLYAYQLARRKAVAQE